VIKSGMPKVSIVIPVRDRLELLDSAVESAIAQAGVSKEIIVVDDGSEPSVQMRKAWDHPGMPVRIVRVEPGGASRARNTGVSNAKGDYVAFLDADDVMLPGKLRRQTECMDALSLSWSCTGFKYVDARTGRWREHSLVHLGPRFWEQCCPFGCSAIVARRDTLDRIGGFDPNLSLAEDWDLIIRLGASGKPAICPEPLYEYRIFCDNTSLLRRQDWDAAWASIARRHTSVVARPTMYYSEVPWWDESCSLTNKGA